MYLMNKERWLFCLPSLKGLERAEVTEGASRYPAVVEVAVVAERGGRLGGVLEAGASRQVGDATVEAFHHPVGLRTPRRDEAVLDAVFGAFPVEGDAPVQFAGQHLQGFAAGPNVVLDRRGRGGLLVQSNQHVNFALRFSGSPSHASQQTR